MILRSTISSILFMTKLFWPRIENETVRILNYHRVCEESYGLSATGIKPSAFEKQMEYLFREQYKTISLYDLCDYIKKGKRFPEKAIVITFDDGYMDNYTHAFGVLKRYHFKATVFLMTSKIGKKYFNASMLTWSRIKEMTKHGIDFGSHTINHPYLTKLSVDEARKEIQKSKDFLEQVLGKEVALFCYPCGDFNNKVKALVKESGYLCACSTIQGGNTFKTDLLSLKRVWMSPKDNLFDLKKKMIGAYDLPYNSLRLTQRLMR